MAQQNKIVGYTNIFGFVLPDWVDEGLIRQVVMVLLTVVIMMGVYLFVINPKLDTIKGMRLTLKSREDNLASLKSSQQGYEKLSEQIPEGKQNMILSAIPLNYSPDEAVFLLRRLCTESGVSIISYKLPSGEIFTTAEDTKDGKNNGARMIDFSIHPIRITVSAPVPALLSFIDKVEKSLPYGVVSDVNMQEVTKMSTISKSVQMDLEIRYYQAELRKVDITKVKQFTDADLSLANEIAGFSSYSLTSESVGGVATGEGVLNTNIFGM